MTKDLVSTYKVIEGENILFPSNHKGESIGICPRCGSHVFENKKGFCCEDRVCHLALWKENKFFTMKKKTLRKSIAIDLLEKWKVSLTGCYSEKTGKTYDAIAETSPFKDIKPFIDFAPNMDYYVLIEDVKNVEDLGNYYLYKSGMVEMPEEWKMGIDPKAFGEHILKDELGQFTKAGYLIKSDDLWLDDYCGKEDIHEDFLISAQAVFKSSQKERSRYVNSLILHIKNQM